MPGRYQVRAAPFLDLNYASLLARLGARRKLLVRTQPRDNPLSILLLAGMNHHLRRPLFLKHCLVFSEANVTLSGSLARACTIYTCNPRRSVVVAVVPGSELAVGPQIVCVCGTVDWKLALAL